MTNSELLAYRKQIINDAVRMNKKPDRTPHFANFWTWKILDSEYKISEVLHDWKKTEDVAIDFLKKYKFDYSADDGVRDPILVVEPIGQSSYEIDDELEVMNIRDFNFMESEDYDLLITNFPKFIWEKVLPRKAGRFNSNLTVSEFGEVIKQNSLCAQCTKNIGKRMAEEVGVAGGMIGTPVVQIGFETLFNFFRGMKELSFDLRRCPDKLKAACDVLFEFMVEPVLNQLKNGTLPAPEHAAFTMCSAMLGHTVLNQKQFEQFYWPYMKKIIDAVVEADATCYIFAEGSSKRFWDYLKDIPKGHIAYHVEQDDIFEFKKELPNICAVGGFHTSLLGGGTKEQCVSYAKHLIDELGNEGFILSQDKMISFRNDCNPENLMALCDFVSSYQN